MFIQLCELPDQFQTITADSLKCRNSKGHRENLWSYSSVNKSKAHKSGARLIKVTAVSVSHTPTGPRLTQPLPRNDRKRNRKTEGSREPASTILPKASLHQTLQSQTESCLRLPWCSVCVRAQRCHRCRAALQTGPPCPPASGLWSQAGSWGWTGSPAVPVQCRGRMHLTQHKQTSSLQHHHHTENNNRKLFLWGKRSTQCDAIKRTEQVGLLLLSPYYKKWSIILRWGQR